MTLDAKSVFEIPLVDFSKYQHGMPAEKAACIAEIMKGFTTSGFLYLRNTGLSPKAAFDWSAKFFALPLEEKAKYPNTDRAANRGYSGFGAEKTTNIDTDDAEGIAALRTAIPDLKESLEIGSDSGVTAATTATTSGGVKGARYPTKPFVNRYTDALPGFAEAMSEFFAQCDDLHHELMSAIAEGLGLDEAFFRNVVTEGDHVLRLLHYPAAPRAVLSKEGAMRAGSHTDFGTVTLLFQDMSGGLQVRTPDGTYMDIPPVEDAIVINAGDLLQVWTNDVIKSTYHQVVSPPNAPTTEDGAYSARYSIAFFAHPDHEKPIWPIQTCCTEANPEKYGSVMPGEWMIKRLTATY
ncbi:hypothetical protein BX600DRAFT_433864 [Xylariales sp. PMI_506]|nr:hypothetical protein BX600DRAFT_433864 [Xylariales sp. PMI_506]